MQNVVRMNVTYEILDISLPWTPPYVYISKDLHSRQQLDCSSTITIRYHLLGDPVRQGDHVRYSRSSLDTGADFG